MTKTTMDLADLCAYLGEIQKEIARIMRRENTWACDAYMGVNYVSHDIYIKIGADSVSDPSPLRLDITIADFNWPDIESQITDWLAYLEKKHVAWTPELVAQTLGIEPIAA